MTLWFAVYLPWQHTGYKDIYWKWDEGGGIMVTWESGSLCLIQSYWIIWLVGSAIVAIVLGAVIIRNYQAVKC